MPRSYVVPLTEPKAGENLPLLSVVNFALRNMAVILISGVVFALLLSVRGIFSAPMYTATTSFITEGEQPAGRLILGGLTIPGTGGRGPEFYMELIKSPAILGPLVESRIEAEPGKPAPTLIERYGGDLRGQAAKELAMKNVAGHMNPKLSPNEIITLKVSAEEPHLAAGIASGVLAQIDAFNDARRKTQASGERKFIEQRLVDVSVEVRVAEERLRDFLERNRDITRSPSLTIERERLGDELSTRRALYTSILQAYEKAKMDEFRESPRATVLARPLPPTQKDRSVSIRNAVLGFFLGMMLAAFFALAREYFARVPAETSPEASEFLVLRQASSDRIRKPLTALASALRGSRQSSPH